MSEDRSKGFLDLPLEIRESIYRHLFQGIVVSPARSAPAQTAKSTVALVFLVSHACYHEARPIFLQTVCFTLGNANTAFQPESQDEMQRMLGQAHLHHVRHLRIPLPYSYESWSTDFTEPFVKLKTLTVVVGLSHLGSQSLPSDPTCADYIKELVESGEGRYTTDLTKATFDNEFLLMWTPPECFVYSYIRRRDELGRKYTIYVQSRPDALSELEREDPSYKQELAFLRLCAFGEIEPTKPQCVESVQVCSS